MTALDLQMSGLARAGELTLDVDVRAAAGETLAVLGPNGAGKTTLLRVLAGLHPLERGTVSLGERTLEDPTRGIRLPPEERSIGVVFQDLLLFDHLDVADNVAFGLRAAGTPRRDARRTAAAWLARLGLPDRAGARCTDLSGGEAQRVALARALAPGPAALLLDEPLTALDADARGGVRRDLRAHLAAQDGPCIVVTHDPLDAAVLADRVVVLEAGRITDAGSLADLVARPRTAWAAELAGTNLLPATATGVRCELLAGGLVVVAEPPGDGPALVAVRPASVALHRHRPEGSPRNVWAVTVAEVEGYAERVRVRLDGEVTLVAEVTTAALRDLQIEVGQHLWASAKATEVTAYPR